MLWIKEVAISSKWSTWDGPYDPWYCWGCKPDGDAGLNAILIGWPNGISSDVLYEKFECGHHLGLYMLLKFDLSTKLACSPVVVKRYSTLFGGLNCIHMSFEYYSLTPTLVSTFEFGLSMQQLHHIIDGIYYLNGTTTCLPSSWFYVILTSISLASAKPF